MAHRPLISFILATHNRADVLLHTLDQLRARRPARHEHEILVVDNASTDRTSECVRRLKPEVQLLELDRNRGSCAKGLALPHATGEYVVFLDDDSYPLGDSVQHMVRHFQDDPALGAAGFMVRLPDGRQECSALPNVFVGCGVGFRRDILNMVGGLDTSYFMQAEEYDLSFRLIRAGYDVRTFDDLRVLHLKSTSSRDGKRTIFYDVRNNLTLAATYLPSPWHREFMRDWTQRYCWLARDLQADHAYQDGRALGLLRGYYRRFARPAWRLDEQTVRTTFGIDLITSKMSALSDEGFWKVLFAGLGKNIWPYFRAARQAGIEVAAVMDDDFARSDRTYRGAPVITCDEGLTLQADAIIVSNSSPVHARQTEQQLRRRTDLPIHRWHGRYEFERESELTIDHGLTAQRSIRSSAS